jgi:hypothetical protein
MTNIVEFYLLGCNAMHFCRCSPTFFRTILPPSSGQKINRIKKPALFDPEGGYSELL